MHWLIFHIVSGHSFFTGVALIVLAALASAQSRPLFKRFTPLFFLVGVIAVVVSSTAIPYWYYVVATAATLVWIASCVVTKWRRWAAFAVASAWLIAVLIELPFQFTRPLRPVSTRSVTVIGDSLTAGIGGERSDTWPNVLARTHQLHVQDISQVGETAASALKHLKSIHIESPVVIVEIGGNDLLLGTGTSTQFAHDLDNLLAHIEDPDRQIIMFELPLPPFCHEYGRVQRNIAAKYNVTLVPKRVLLSVIASGDLTVDAIHLSRTGHQMMADCVWRLVESAYDSHS